MAKKKLYFVIVSLLGNRAHFLNLVVGLLHLVSLKQPTFLGASRALLLWSLMAHSHLHKRTKPSKQTNQSLINRARVRQSAYQPFIHTSVKIQQKQNQNYCLFSQHLFLEPTWMSIQFQYFLINCSA